jgi:4-amino-4-deoxy-L-arabinose transferase-like glycosyltransferase
MAQRLRSEWPIIVFVAIFVVLGVVYSTMVPLWESPDEVANFEYVAHLVNTHSLPVQQSGVLDAAHHPPLYYTVAALASSVADLDDSTGAFQHNPKFVWSGSGGTDHNAAFHHTAETFPYRGIALAVHLARWVSIAIGAVTVVLTYAIARRVFPGSQGLALFAAALTAFNPQFLFIGGSVNLDVMAAMTCALALWQLIRTLKKPLRWKGWALTGAFCGLAVLSKSSAFTIGLVAGVLLLISVVRRRSWSLLWRGALALGLAFFLVSGWWFVRNWILYGDPLGWQTFLSNWGAVRRYTKVKWQDIYKFLSTQFQSYWARFGWMTISVPKWVYLSLQALCGASFLGWVKWLWQHRYRALGRPQLLGLVALVLLPLLQETFQFRSIFIFNDSWYQGRYLFTAIAPLSTLLAAGLWYLIPDRVVKTACGAMEGGLLILAIILPIAVIRPHYVTPTLAKWQVWTLPHRYSDVVFGERLRLLGYRAAGSDDHSVSVTLYWQALQRSEVDYSAFMHVIDETGELVTQGDAGLGSDHNFPTSAWRPEDIVPSQHTITLPSDSSVDDYEVRVGVYFWADGARLSMTEKNVFAGDYITLDESALRIP